MYQILIESFKESLFLLLVPGSVAVILGIPIGMLLTACSRDSLYNMTKLSKAITYLNIVICNSPYLLIMAVFYPFYNQLENLVTSNYAAAFLLTLIAISMIINTTYKSLRKVDNNIYEMASTLGATPWQTIAKIILPEAYADIIKGVIVSFIQIVGLTMIAGVLGAGGLGHLAIEYGVYQSQQKVAIMCLVLALLISLSIYLVGQLFLYRAKIK